ncbi:MAG TPA: hypothetical protein VMS43_06505 [Allosphingosinicella sp.]|nr:hypothetical protein [Allosphingosinicella sp.]
MLFRLGLTALAVVAVPVVVAAQSPSAAAPRKSERRICRSEVDLGSRVARVRRCYSQSEYVAMKQESRETVDRVQSLKIVSTRETIPARPGLSHGGAPR